MSALSRGFVQRPPAPGPIDVGHTAPGTPIARARSSAHELAVAAARSLRGCLAARCVPRAAAALLVAGGLGAAGPAAAAPASASSMDCAAATDAVETAICSDDALAALDAKLVTVYAAASKAAAPAQRNRLAADQQRWLEARGRCAGAPDHAACISERYINRIADLQAQFKLVASRGPFRFECDRKPGNVLDAQFFETEPPTARFSHGGRTVTAFLARSGSGARYEGPTVSYWEHQGEASVVWFGHSMKCRTR
jgi:uncharacterized protein